MPQLQQEYIPFLAGIQLINPFCRVNRHSGRRFEEVYIKKQYRAALLKN
jgi:hypothetical protein